MQVQSETEALIRDFKLRERFGSSEESNKFMLDSGLGQNPDQEPMREESGHDNSDDDIPRHRVPYHNEQIVAGDNIDNENIQDKEMEGNAGRRETTTNDQQSPIFQEE